MFKFSSCFQVGDAGAGHYVKMVHNGIEYGDMQLICEAYHIMKDTLGMSPPEIGKVLHSSITYNMNFAFLTILLEALLSLPAYSYDLGCLVIYKDALSTCTYHICCSVLCTSVVSTCKFSYLPVISLLKE